MITALGAQVPYSSVAPLKIPQKRKILDVEIDWLLNSFLIYLDKFHFPKYGETEESFGFDIDDLLRQVLASD